MLPIGDKIYVNVNTHIFILMVINSLVDGEAAEGIKEEKKLGFSCILHFLLTHLKTKILFENNIYFLELDIMM